LEITFRVGLLLRGAAERNKGMRKCNFQLYSRGEHTFHNLEIQSSTAVEKVITFFTMLWKLLCLRDCYIWVSGMTIQLVLRSILTIIYNSYNRISRSFRWERSEGLSSMFFTHRDDQNIVCSTHLRYFTYRAYVILQVYCNRIITHMRYVKQIISCRKWQTKKASHRKWRRPFQNL